MNLDLLHQETATLLRQDLGDVGHSEYDAAWVARVPRTDQRNMPEFPRVLEEILRRQSDDGGWEKDARYVSTRIQTTLASCLALLQFPLEPHYLERARHGAHFTQKMWERLPQDPEPALGFELVVASLIEEACRMGLPLSHLRQDSRDIQARKLARVTPDLIYSPRLSIGFSLEFMLDDLDVEKALHLRVANGSLGDSIAATAHHARLSGDPTSYAFLRRIVNTYGPARIPYAEGNLWGTIWTLYNLDLAGLLSTHKDLAAPHIAQIEQHIHDEGISWSSHVAYGDGDDTAIGFHVLDNWGSEVNWDLLRQYERDEGFITFRAESHPSTSTNANVLTAISKHPYDGSRETSEKIIRILLSWRNADGFWTDKWHASPFYPTSRAMLAIIRAERANLPDLVPTIEWLLRNQRDDGSWGFFESGTAEETAYAVQALTHVFRAGYDIHDSVFLAAERYLIRANQHGYDDHPKLWIAKSLYGPISVIRSAVISALALIQGIGSSASA